MCERKDEDETVADTNRGDEFVEIPEWSDERHT